MTKEINNKTTGINSVSDLDLVEGTTAINCGTGIQIDGGRYESYLLDCFVKCRPDEKAPALFTNDGEKVVCALRGYAIIPIEEYHELKAK